MVQRGWKYLDVYTGMHRTSQLGAYQVKHGYSDAFKLIHKYCDDQNPTDSTGQSVLHVAALSGEFEIVKAIIENVQNKNPKDDDDWTPLHSASLQGIIYILRQ